MNRDGRQLRTDSAARRRRTGARLALFAVLAAGAIAPAAAGQIVFTADVKAHIAKPTPCGGGASLCGSADIPGFGPASFRLSLTSFGPPSSPCGVFSELADYGAIVVFTLADGSSLTLDEAGTACAPGDSFLAPGALRSFGNPRSWSGTWTVQQATGRLAGLTGNGIVTGTSAGAELAITYTGTLEA